MIESAKQDLLVRFHEPGLGPRVGVRRGDVVHDVTTMLGSLTDWLRNSSGRVTDAIVDLQEAAQATSAKYSAARFDQVPMADAPHWLAPVDDQDIWAAGVTYERSRAARQEEARDGGDVYARVYLAERPELFFKARGPWAVGPRGHVGIRRDAGWNVPEPELALVLNPALEVVGVTIGNDMSSRDIEGENPLYLPQAKIYRAACALGPGILLTPVDDVWPETKIRLTLERDGRQIYSGETNTRQIRRRPGELIEYLGRCLDFPAGAVLLTGTGVVPPEDFTLGTGDVVTITVDLIGTLCNSVVVV